MSSNMEIAALRDKLQPEDIKNVLALYDVYPVHETDLYVQYPTCCHNISGGSHKLYYYKNTGLFRCYTECDTIFDIFELLIKMNALRGQVINLPQAIRITGLETTNIESITAEDRLTRKHMEEIRLASLARPPQVMEMAELKKEVLNRYSFNLNALQPWIEEDIGIDALRRFNIKYDLINVAIVIPHFDKEGRLIGVRGRFMAPDALNKYMPLSYGGEFLAHSLGQNLYGIYENREAIKRSKTVVLFESEKSVMKMDTAFGPEKNFALATCGNKVSNEQIVLLRELGVQYVVLAFDKDYTTPGTRRVVQEKYEAIARRLNQYFTTSIILDFGDVLNYKDSPIDQGKQTFLNLYQYRYYI